MRRPIMESSANWYSRVRRSSAVISVAVGRGAHFDGPSSGHTGRTCWASTGAADTKVASRTVATARKYLSEFAIMMKSG
jgi:hypothetical protein